MQIDFNVNTFNPFLGRLVVKKISTEANVQNYLKKQMGMEENSLLVLPENVGDKNRVPFTTAEICIIGIASFGDRFEKWYGKDAQAEGKSLKVGDIVQFL